MSNSKSLLDFLPAPKSSQNIFKPRTVTTTNTAPPPPTNFNKQSKSTLNQQPIPKKPEISSNAIISSKPIPAGSTSKIQKTGNFFSLNYGNDTDEEEAKEEEEEIFEDKVINPVRNRYSETNANNAASIDSSVADILRFEGKKRRHDNSIINIVDVNVKDVIDKNKEELLKNLTTDAIKPPARTLGTSKKHHQITYLAAMAKERESELSKTWSDNKFNRKLSKSKYGF